MFHELKEKENGIAVVRLNRDVQRNQRAFIGIEKRNGRGKGREGSGMEGGGGVEMRNT